jgi:F-type H+/Na+-transporting ATPase subunit beta
LPDLYEALEITRDNGEKLILEVQQDIGENTVRTIAMDSTDGLKRGLEAVALGKPISMPTGDQIKGRLFNVIGQPIDGLKPIESKKLTAFTANLQNTKIFLHNQRCFIRESKLLI